ncbi:hypothetical protein CPB86DRAFT_784142 [Serendipita vermifera]|nr:hypothetical protein CPB86DRAFT_784142 [Serendipita vermifera]
MAFHDGRPRDAGKRKDRPPSLTFGSHDHDSVNEHGDNPRPSLGSMTSQSTLDPYYFTATIAAPVISSTPEPPMPQTNSASTAMNPPIPNEPKTPAINPSSIDRGGLIGVGDLTTPRWTSRANLTGRSQPRQDGLSGPSEMEENEDGSTIEAFTIASHDQQDNDIDRSSPWTIEAVDESDTNEPSSYIVPSPPPIPVANPESPAPKTTYVPAEPRSVRSKRSVEESAGEEILYPRTLSKSRGQSDSAQASPYATASKVSSASESAVSHSLLSHKNSASVSSTPRRHRKRASEDTSPQGSSVMGGFSPMSSPKDETHVRRHRSLGVSPPALPPVSQQRDLDRDRARERRRQDATNSVMTPTRSNSTSKDHGHRERHARRSSASSSNGQIVELSHSRRTHDFSHLPPSPSSTALQHILKNTTVNHGGTPSPLPAQGSVGSSSSVAHSLLRGTQEGWSGLDDSATAEALRKLDGISGRSLRARSSVISVASKSSSRPGTPGSKTGHQQWEGMEPAPLTKRRSSGALNLRDAIPVNASGQTTAAPTPPLGPSHSSERVHGDNDMMTIKSSTTPVGGRANGASPLKRSSESSTNTHFTSTDTPTSVSRDSTSMSTSASVSSVQTSSRRHSLTSNGRVKRSNSIGSDTSSIHSEKDRAASLATGVEIEPAMIPPVPPLPKAYQTPPGTAHQGHMHISAGQNNYEDAERNIVPPIEVQAPPRGHGLVSAPSTATGAIFPTSPSSSATHLVPSGTSTGSAPPLPSSPSATATRSPSKKWSFSSLNLRLPSGSSKDSSNADSMSPRSPRKASSSSRNQSTSSPAVKQQQLPPRLSSSADREQDPLSSSPATSSLFHRKSPSPRLSSSSVHPSQHPFPTSYPQAVPSPTRRSTDRQSRPGSNNSHYTNATSTHGTQTKESQPQGSPTRRPSTTRRLTPSSIPFFRRSSTHSINSPAIGTTGNGPTSAPATSPRSPASLMPSSPLMPVMTSSTGSLGNPATTPSLTRATPPTADITSSPGSSAHRKSVLMGLPSLLKGSNSRRSVHAGDKSDSEKKAKEEKIREKEEKLREKERKREDKKEEKERSESRISVLMGRRRGKTLSSGDARKTKSTDPDLPPMQMPGIPSSTAQRVANLRASVASGAHKIGIPSTPPTKSKPLLATSRASPSSPSQKTPTVNAKSSDLSLRTNRQQLPTIAGSPSVSTVGSKEGAAMAAAANGSATPKDPTGPSTKIPRISSRTSAGGSPQPALKSSMSSSKRSSIAAQSTAPSEVSTSLDEFGLLGTPGDNKATATAGNNRYSVRASPQSSSKTPRYAGNTISSSASTSSIRKPTRDSSISLNGMRKSSTASVNSVGSSLASGSVNNMETPPSRFSALSPAKSIKMLSPKVSLQSPRATQASASPALRQGSSSSSDRHSFSTPSPVPAAVDEEELLGDEEMMDYIRRQQARRIAAGAKKEDLDEMLKFPEPIAPAPGLSPQAVLKSSQAVYLSDYERKEILDYPSVYYIGARSDKKLATRDNSTNNYSYDDDRGDYQVINRDHLAYRYEVIDTLGKGSFGQVLQCRDHCTGESVAIKIIRNKKRFHHQALVEIKILDNLRKWDPDEKHHVIKMTEHFYFRNHLCIAMELLSINLYELIKANGFVGFTTNLIRRFTSQMLGSLALMRHHRVVHCDLKPENILLRHPAKSGIKVIDFGSSCLEHEKVYTYIQSRFYRSPEVILGMSYNMAIDMWSLGCILAELYTGFPIFPGENEQEQLACIMEVLGVPDKDIITRSSRRRIFFDSSGAPRPVVNSKGRRRRPGTKTLSQVLRCDDADFVDFIAKCLVWDPERRLKPQSAMRHPFITGGRSKMRAPLSGPSTAARNLLGSSSSTVSKISKLTSSNNPPETSKKIIGPPTPLTARTTRVSGGPSAGVSTSVSTGSLHSSLSSQRTHRYHLATTGKLS